MERKVQNYLEEHTHVCKKDFKGYEEHFHENVGKMNAYISEIHDSHISEMTTFKREKDDQVIINNMLVKRLQRVEGAN